MIINEQAFNFECSYEYLARLGVDSYMDVIASIGTLAWSQMLGGTRMVTVTFCRGGPNHRRIVIAPTHLAGKSGLRACEEIIRKIGNQDMTCREYEEQLAKRNEPDDMWKIPF